MTPAAALELARPRRGMFDLALIMAFISTESGDAFNIAAPVNERAFLNDRNGGSYGLMQLDVPTARDRGFKGAPADLYDPATNITFGVAQLTWLWDRLKKRSLADRDSLAAAYNEGLGKVFAGIADPHYVGRIEAARISWRQALGEGP